MKTSQTRPAVITAILLMAVNGLLYLAPIYRLVGADAVLWINNLTDIVVALVSIWLGFRLWRSTERGESQWWIWGSLLTGVICWAIAEIIWDSYQLFTNNKLPSASPADLAWILGYIALTTGLILRLRAFRMRPKKRWQFAVLAAYGVLAVLVVIYMIIPTLQEAPTGVFYKKFIDVFYPICDLALGLLALLLVLVLEGGLLSRPWATIALACLCVAISDLLYAFAIAQGIYQVDPAAGLNVLSYMIDVSYTFAYILMALGLYLQARLLDAI